MNLAKLYITSYNATRELCQLGSEAKFGLEKIQQQLIHKTQNLKIGALKREGISPQQGCPISGTNQRCSKKSANKHSFNRTQAGNTGSMKILKRRGAHTSHRLKLNQKHNTSKTRSVT